MNAFFQSKPISCYIGHKGKSPTCLEEGAGLIPVS